MTLAVLEALAQVIHTGERVFDTLADNALLIGVEAGVDGEPFLLDRLMGCAALFTLLFHGLIELGQIEHVFLLLGLDCCAEVVVLLAH